MLATQNLPFPGAPGTRAMSASELCQVMRSRAATPVPVALPGLDRVLRHDAQRGLVEVQGGAPWSALADWAGAAFLPGTIGDSVAGNAAGPDGRTLVTHLRSFTLVTADGELRRASRESAPELFALAAGGQGVFGPFYSVTLDLGSLARSAAAAAAPVQLALDPVADEGCSGALEVLVPPQATESFVAALRTALEEHRCALTRLEARRVLPEAETFLRWARRDYAALRIDYRYRATLGANVGAAQLSSRLLDLAIAAGGAVGPGHLPLASRAQAEACYPNLAAFLAEKRRYDPAERITTAWYRSTRDLLRREPCAVRWSRD